jgi:hypothetical protein
MSKSDYFDRMIERALGQVPALEPRRAARFEAPSAMPAFNTLDEFIEPASVSDSSSRRSAQPDERVASRKIAQEISHPLNISPSVAEHSAQPVILHQEALLPGHGVEQATAAAHPMHSKLETVSFVPVPVAGEAASPRQTTGPFEPRIERHVEIIERETSTVETRFDNEGLRPLEIAKRIRAAEREIQELAQRQPPVKKTEPERQTGQRQSDGARRTILVHDVRPATLPSINPLPKRTAPAPDERTVQINIGRIEVRAQAERPAVTGRRRAPQLGLDEYLRRRQGA